LNQEDAMSKKMIRCAECKGAGIVIKYPSSADAIFFHKQPIRINCPSCGGKGWVQDNGSLGSIAFCAIVGFALGGPVGAAIGGALGGAIDTIDKSSRR
jgi:hypothetical protein